MILLNILLYQYPKCIYDIINNYDPYYYNFSYHHHQDNYWWSSNHQHDEYDYSDNNSFIPPL